MKRLFAFFLIWFCVAGPALPAYAQVQTGEGRSWATIQMSARCLVDSWPGVVQEIVSAFPGSTQYKAALAPLANSNCAANDEFAAPAELVRGSLFQALYVKSYPDNAPALSASPLNIGTEVLGQTEEKASNFITLRQYGECVVRRDPNTSRALTLSLSGSQEENQAFAALQPTLNQCLIAGGQVSFSKAVLTGIVAEVLYRLSVPSWR